MAWFLFIDEIGHDRLASPYEVLAGVAIRDQVLRELIARLHDAEVASFGRRYSDGHRELKGAVLLKRKVFRHGALSAELDLADLPSLARAALDDGARANARMLKSLALAKLDYFATLFDTCAQFGCRAFASIVETDAQPTTGRGLRKDYAYLFERFFYFLEDNAADEQGIVVFDELEKSKSHLLIDQMHRYFEETAVGRHRASRIIPEPFFVHSDLTTGVQIADLLAYVISWRRSPSKLPGCATGPYGRGSATANSKSGASRTSPTCGPKPNATKISE